MNSEIWIETFILTFLKSNFHLFYKTFYKSVTANNFLDITKFFPEFSEHNSVCEKVSSNYTKIYECSLRAYDGHVNIFRFSRIF